MVSPTGLLAPLASLHESIEKIKLGLFRQRRRPSVRAAQLFSHEYFGKIVTGLDGSNGYRFTSPGAFGVVVRTDISDPGKELLALFPCPVLLDSNWMDVTRFRLATPAEIRRILQAPKQPTSGIPSGTLVELQEPHVHHGFGEKQFFAAGTVGVVDHEDDLTGIETATELDRQVGFSKKTVRLPDGTELSYHQLLTAATTAPALPVVLSESYTETIVPLRSIRVKTANPLALDRVVLDSRIKQRLLQGLSMLDQQRREQVAFGWNLRSLPGASGFVALIYGQPGTGKTTLAHALAETVGRPMFRISGEDLGKDPDGFTDAVSSAMRRAERLDAILLIEEADQILMRRSNHMHPIMLAKVSEMLQRLESFAGVMLLTSNRPFVLDDAAKSRLNLIVEMPAMQPDLREAILLRSLPKELPIQGVLPLNEICQMDLDGRALRMIVTNAARCARTLEMDAVPAGFLLDEARILSAGLQNLKSDASYQRILDDSDES